MVRILLSYLWEVSWPMWMIREVIKWLEIEPFRTRYLLLWRMIRNSHSELKLRILSEKVHQQFSFIEMMCINRIDCRDTFLLRLEQLRTLVGLPYQPIALWTQHLPQHLEDCYRSVRTVFSSVKLADPWRQETQNLNQILFAAGQFQQV